MRPSQPSAKHTTNSPVDGVIFLMKNTQKPGEMTADIILFKNYFEAAE